MHVRTRSGSSDTAETSTTESRRRRAARRSLDIAVSATLLTLLSPLLIGVALAIRLSSKGPALFRQTRVGLHGKHFVMLKFRTMKVNSSDQAHRDYVTRLLIGEPTREAGLYKLDGDTRVTRVGAVLRRLSIDELPQLLNVLRGDMSLVGPRPALPWECDMFPPFALARFDVPPGLTGLWQVSGRNRLTFLQGLELDVEYAARQSTWLDVKILVQTVPAVLRGGAR